MSSIFERSVRSLSDILSLGAANPNKTEVERALSLDVEYLDSVSKKELLKYLTVLGQYLITLKFAENLKKAAYTDISKVFEHKVNMKMLSFDDDNPGMKKRTVKEKRSFLVENNEELGGLNENLSAAEIEYNLLSNMSKPVEEYINVLKRVLDNNYGNMRGMDV